MVFADPIVYPVGEAPARVLAADVDDDDILDLIVSNFSCCDRRLFVLLGNGDGTFTSQHDFVVESHAIGGAADFDGDGDVDIAVTNPGSGFNWFVVRLNEGVTGTDWNGFSRPTARIQMDNSPQGLASGDLDRDGDTDLVVGSASDVRILHNNGTSNGKWNDFTVAEQHPAAGDHSSTVRVGHVDHDSDLDIVVGNYRSGDITLLLGRGDGSFDESGTFEVGHRSGSVELGDFDGDGNLDVATAIFHRPMVAWLRGNGQGDFETRVELPVSRRVDLMRSGDFDNDGDLDLIAVSEQSIHLLVNQGDGTFVEQAEDLGRTGGSNQGSVVADLDSDGDLDLAVTTAFQSGLSCANCGVEVFLNETINLQMFRSNLTGSGIASQSSTSSDRFAASMAIDGNLRTFSRTAGEEGHWWQFELSDDASQIAVIDEIVVRSRSTPMHEDLTSGGGLHVQILDDLGNPVWGDTYTGTVENPLRITVSTDDQQVMGRTIRISKIAPIESVFRLNAVEIWARDFVLSADHLISLDVNATNQTSDLLRFEGNLHILGATLRVGLVDGVFAEGMQFHLLDTSSTTGAFGRFLLPELPSEIVWNTSQLSEQGLLTIDTAGPAGDFDGDGEVGFRDFLILSSTFGKSGTGLLADVDENETVDFKDFLVLSDNFGANRG